MPKKNLNNTSATLRNQTGKLSYNMTNDYMFRAVLQTVLSVPLLRKYL